MTTDQVNYLNIGLMILSCIVAFILPFELFLFSYAILGPLHYLTEMSWLHKRRFFVPGKRDYLLLAAIAFVILFPTLFKAVYHLFAAKNSTGETIYAADTLFFVRHLTHIGRTMIFVSFATAAVLIFIRNAYKRAAAVALIIALALLTRSVHFVTIIFAIFLPTLIHVFIFTGAFIVAGAVKHKSLSAVLSVVVFLGCALSLFILFPHPVNHASGTVLDAYQAGFYSLNKQVFATFLHTRATRNDVYFSGTGILVTRFIAYAYTYHYLNWFSKTSVIKWHLVPRRSLVVVLIIWALAVTLYVTNYRTGLTLLYFLSLLHVIFEFPLNIRSFRDIGNGVRDAFKGSREKA